MYVCICNAVTDGQITKALNSGCEDVSQLSQTLGVGTCCGSCLPTAEELVERVRDSRLAIKAEITNPADLGYPA